jgi:hypothetical protein
MLILGRIETHDGGGRPGTRSYTTLPWQQLRAEGHVLTYAPAGGHPALEERGTRSYACPVGRVTHAADEGLVDMLIERHRPALERLAAR